MRKVPRTRRGETQGQKRARGATIRKGLLDENNRAHFTPPRPPRTSLKALLDHLLRRLYQAGHEGGNRRYSLFSAHG